MPADLNSHREMLVDDLKRVALRDRWGVAIMVVGWMHLSFFGVNQALYSLGGYPDSLFALLWLEEVVAIGFGVRWLLGPGWFKATPLAGQVVRVWGTFLILSFNVAMMNNMTGWTLDWFKLVWATLSSFGFAMMAWLVNLWFLVFAFQMYFTGLLMVRFPSYCYLIESLSWCLALQVIGLNIERLRIRERAGQRETAPAETPSRIVPSAPGGQPGG